MNYRMYNPFTPAFVPNPPNRRFRRATRIVDGKIFEMIGERRRGGQPADDLLAMLMRRATPTPARA